MFSIIYGAGEEGVSNRLSEAMLKSNPSLKEGEIKDAIDKINTTINSRFPSLKKLDGLLTQAVTLNPDKGSTNFQWRLPDGVWALSSNTEYTPSEASAQTSKGGSEKITVAPQSYRASNDLTTTEGQDNAIRKLKANVMLSIDAWMMRTVINNTNYPIQAIHDSYGVQLKNVDNLVSSVKDAQRALLQGDLMSSILHDISGGRMNHTTKKDKIDLESADHSVS